MKKLIYIIDDDSAILDIIKIILEGQGFLTTLISDGVEFFKKIKKKKPDLILLDIWLTGIDGIEIAKRLKASKKFARIPIIIISANNKGKQLSASVGADGFLAKPFEIDDLINIINQALSTKSHR
ncbi:hypothetical protein A3D78_02015 [Candidatus Gottesmanbacteria bacterium RIFCSPHIGHO2_02_FULL_39_14]|uniref:Response regulatory domain-containing protein n=3 Tax=Candidatus Gottesmaniibacteriota TaxID=1752720 RepID=A0A1F6A281_9BACT|nr:MAG: hypothetical protein A2153_04855 [Candidatus Gottesmanbacteria bacterium RBG_16_38_7b]OGG18770.1 MAG: hypothetical protein A3D78_02015 [Candidatus Gottesmanbacteria bacterium RIFCSPHIGHO2_02_FULL_39_14]OGG30946.1 MAG: hypothetical protein A3I51_02660 [Candidatus Gottesmanbacteria bacterium RIFCSPLOWO2_02_FULL_38_8]